MVSGSRQLLDEPALAEAHRERRGHRVNLGGRVRLLSAVQVPQVSELACLQLITDALGAERAGP